MGAIGGEELIKCVKMQGLGACEEKIFVSVRLRPLNEKEVATNEAADWECLNDTTILYRNTLREGSTFPSAYTFDRVFQGDCSTKKVYEEGAKEIALSVVSGINSSIFAYGQTSSGKTYTMIGITEYTVSDIFDYIHKHEERAFVLKFSAIEIYNESIRDLLSTENTSLRLLDDPEKGTIVEKVTEEILRDWNHLKELLSICETQRRIGETSLNEKSSRSHQIIKLTIESSAREFLGKGNSTTLSASVNLVDLAGSERASQALSAGARLKEGCHINRSLLTLSTVIRKLSTGRHGHINYRDSKLTRMLQPSLGGNARTAIICTLSPARSHVEQSRNTLLFACCAKEVTTKAQVNVVMTDKALVKHLQKELARLESELRTPGPTSSASDYTALLRKKDLQIEKLEKEIKELCKQRDLAKTQIEELLSVVENYKNSKEDRITRRKWQPTYTWEGGCSDSEISSQGDPTHRDAGVRKFSNPHYDDIDHMDDLEDNSEERSPSDDGCKEVKCIEIEESSSYNKFNSHTSGEHEGMRVSNMSGNGHILGPEEMRLIPANGVSPYAVATDMSGSRHLDLFRGSSCEEGILISSSSPSTGEAAQIESTPPSGFEREFHKRPVCSRRTIPPLNFGANAPRLSRNDSQSSIESAFTEQSLKATDEDITSIDTFLTGLKEMAQLQYEKQQVDSQNMESEADKFERNVKDIGLDPMHEAVVPSPNWQLEFERQQCEIIELWQACYVSLVHRTYFFLLFRGDKTDAIYMEVELRRLSFLKETFSYRNHAVQNGQTVSLTSSLRALHRERDMLVKLMQKRLSAEERNKLYQKWGIGLDSKQRRLQLVDRLWSSTTDMNHVIESAAIIAKLIKFSEQEQDIKGMLGLSFLPQRTRRRSYSWINSMSSFL